MFEALHTVDESGSRCTNPEGWKIGVFDSIDAAESALVGYAGGYVRRSEDGAVLSPVGDWIS